MDVKILSGSVYIDHVQGFIKKLDDIASEYDVTVQALNADKLAGKQHLEFAVKKALRAIENGYNRANDTGIEIMRYASGKRQIGDAFNLGIHNGTNNIAFVILGSPENISYVSENLNELITTNPVLAYDESKRDLILSEFDITQPELDAVGEHKIPELVLERVALVDVLK
jgi:KEOPS complex subunit Cgi121